MFLAKRKDGQRGVAIVMSMSMLNDEWEVDRSMVLSKFAKEIEIDKKKMNVFSKPLIKFHVKFSNMVPMLNIEEGEE